MVIRDVHGKFTHYKIIHRYYYIPVRLHKMGLIQNNLCWKCNIDGGTLLHSLWEYCLVFPFWKDVTGKLGEWFEKFLTETPQFCSLGDKTESPPGISKAEYGSALTGFITAAVIILLESDSTRIY